MRTIKLWKSLKSKIRLWGKKWRNFTMNRRLTRMTLTQQSDEKEEPNDHYGTEFHCIFLVFEFVDFAIKLEGLGRG